MSSLTWPPQVKFAGVGNASTLRYYSSMRGRPLNYLLWINFYLYLLLPTFYTKVGSSLRTKPNRNGMGIRPTLRNFSYRLLQGLETLWTHVGYFSYCRPYGTNLNIAPKAVFFIVER